MKISLMFLAVASILLVCTADLRAQSTRDAELNSSDAELNKIYKAIMMKLDKDGQAKLKAAQLAWIKFRDLDCKWAFTDTRDCLMDRTEHRTKELEETWFFDASKEYKQVVK